MHFCSKCSNMYYIQLTEERNGLQYYCRNCGNIDTTLDANNVVVSKTDLKKTQQQYNHIINKYTKHDPTLPRIKNINCPNDECLTNIEGSEVEKEVIYIRYDNDDMKYIYLCAVCDKVWKLENKS